MWTSVTRRVELCTTGKETTETKVWAVLKASAMAGNRLGAICPDDHSRKFMTRAVQKDEKIQGSLLPLEVTFLSVQELLATALCCELMVRQLPMMTFKSLSELLISKTETCTTCTLCSQLSYVTFDHTKCTFIAFWSFTKWFRAPCNSNLTIKYTLWSYELLC